MYVAFLKPIFTYHATPKRANTEHSASSIRYICIMRVKVNKIHTLNTRCSSYIPIAQVR